MTPAMHAILELYEIRAFPAQIARTSDEVYELCRYGFVAPTSRRRDRWYRITPRGRLALQILRGIEQWGSG